jgi:hypothetical protein
MSDPEKLQVSNPELVEENKQKTRQYMSACEGRQIVRVDVGAGERALAEDDGNGMKEILDEVLYSFLRAHQDVISKVDSERFATSKYVFLMTFDEGPLPIEEGDDGPKELNLG